MKTMENEKQKPVLLSVLAHPDDETFGMGGTLAYYARNGVDVYLVCATRGEVGEVDPKLLEGHKDIAEVREGELRCAAGVLGLKGVHFLDYRDSGMQGSLDNQHHLALAAAPLEEVAVKVAAQIRKLRPQVVLTFDPIGGYRHPDHIAIQRATVRAFQLAGDLKYIEPDGIPPHQPQKLFFHTMPRSFLWTAVLMILLSGKDPSKFGANRDIDLLSIAREHFPVHASIDYTSVREIRDRAAKCHISQGGAEVANGAQAWLRQLFQKKELFMQAYPAPRGRIKLRDLFSGIKIS